MLGRRVVKVERSNADEYVNTTGNGEVVFRVWYENGRYEYVWAKDEIEAFKRVMRDERGLGG